MHILSNRGNSTLPRKDNWDDQKAVQKLLDSTPSGRSLPQDRQSGQDLGNEGDRNEKED